MHQLGILGDALGVAEEHTDLAHVPRVAETCLVDAALDALVERDAERGLIVLELVVHLLGEQVAQDELARRVLECLAELLILLEVARRVNVRVRRRERRVTPRAFLGTLALLHERHEAAREFIDGRGRALGRVCFETLREICFKTFRKNMFRNHSEE